MGFVTRLQHTSIPMPADGADRLVVTEWTRHVRHASRPASRSGVCRRGAPLRKTPANEAPTSAACYGFPRFPTTKIEHWRGSQGKMA